MQQDAADENDGIQWPERFHPSSAAFHAPNETFADDVDPGAAWAWLIRAEQWSEWYDNCSDLEFLGSTTGPDLEAGTTIRWRTLGTTIETEIVEFEPPRRLAWRGSGFGWEAYHAWLIDEREEGCLLRTEETQRGIVPTLLGWYLKPRILEWHQRWVEGLAEQAAAGPPAER